MLATTATGFAQNDDYRDFIVTHQKDYTRSENWKYEPVWGLNSPGYSPETGRAKVRETIRNFFANVNVEVKEGKDNNGSLLFISHKEPITYMDMWYISGYKYIPSPLKYERADEATSYHKQNFVDRLNEWMEPFGFQVEMAKNSEIGRMRYRHLINYNEYGLWITIKPNQRAAFKKAKDSGFSKVVKVVNTRGNLSYHPYRDLMIEYNEKHKNDRQNDQHNPSPFDDGEIRIGN